MSSSYGEELETGPAARSGTAPVPHPTTTDKTGYHTRLFEPSALPGNDAAGLGKLPDSYSQWKGLTLGQFGTRQAIDEGKLRPGVQQPAVGRAARLAARPLI
jgi:hypothetical protein